MPSYVHLDANFLIAASALNSVSRKRLNAWIDDGVALGISAMAWAEFRCGPVDADIVALWEKALGEAIVSVDRKCADRAADLFNASGRRQRSLPDCLIAACAIAVGAKLATLNSVDFEPFVAHGLVLA